jgi:hypothetical protein
MINLSRIRPIHSKKRLIIFAGVLLVLVLAVAYSLWSKQTWDVYRPTYTQQEQAIKIDLATVATAKVTTPEERTEVLAHLVTLSEKIATTDQAVCHIHPFVAWQAKLGKALAAAQADCSAMVSQVAQLQTPLKKVTTYTKNDNELATILAAIPQTGELADDTWDKQVVLWQDCASAVDRLSVGSDFAPVKQSALTKVNAVRDAWQAVIAAHQAKDKAKYIAAQGGLAQSLDGLNELSVTSEKELSGLVKELEKAAATAISS